MTGSILFLDDDRYEMLPLVEYLEYSGFDVKFVNNPRDAVKEIRDGFQPDLVITDLIMRLNPDQSVEESHRVGIDFCRVLREELNVTCPIIVMTVLTEEPVLRDARRFAERALHKPVTPDDLVGEVRRLLKCQSAG